MVYITNYNTNLIKINKDNSDILFLEKEGLSVSGVGGNIIFTNGGLSYTYSYSDVRLPVKNTLDELLVTVREYIDNV